MVGRTSSKGQPPPFENFRKAREGAIEFFGCNICIPGYVLHFSQHLSVYAIDVLGRDVHESQPYRSIDSVSASNTLVLVSFLIGKNHTVDNALRAPHAFGILVSTSWEPFKDPPRYTESSTLSTSEPSRACTLLSEVALNSVIFGFAAFKKSPMDFAAFSTLFRRSSVSLMVLSVSAMWFAYANSANSSSGSLRLPLFL